mmetsp:Transcript_30110/g.82727  ORF Transcript_30110/g.82727 Transcript_30110/m.82727 type:complete len:205 (-) Transcript_30110:92-706(-)|eukprot:CAMPEP_0168831862 /NCGR_PEP_ID=MMETSP0727-20121128/2260_1 /TAXON_ID=265536 /ORGANISM="Amphiprora sp., Strain CCMP467" /LENGTH=204 /DNA_ID=CAMNT_0008885127 /DNA_START=55 /DNA_END=669 /DNA_ORIENTATION=-
MASARQTLMKIAVQRIKEKSSGPNRMMLEAAKMKRWNIVRGDLVEVIGNHPAKGMQGIVKEVKRKEFKVLVEGVNKKKMFMRSNPEKGIKGRQIEREQPIVYSNLALVDPIKKVPTRIEYRILDDGTKVRVAKKSGAVIPKPELLKHRRRPVRFTVTESCTAEEDVWEETYDMPERLRKHMPNHFPKKMIPGYGEGEEMLDDGN